MYIFLEFPSAPSIFECTYNIYCGFPFRKEFSQYILLQNVGNFKSKEYLSVQILAINIPCKYLQYLENNGNIPCKYWQHTLQILSIYLANIGNIPCKYWQYVYLANAEVGVALETVPASWLLGVLNMYIFIFNCYTILNQTSIYF